MVRTIVTIPEEDKKWADQYSKTHHQSFAETVRLALKKLRRSQKNDTYRAVLQKAYGLWAYRKGDAVDYVNKLRSEWK
ncbi:MAG: hypothetical protein HY209_07740 [Candidatus Omnitrophica bacterium]|nr:hypothetical protein [Candidatus Omnitrophota bacterium]